MCFRKLRQDPTRHPFYESYFSLVNVFLSHNVLLLDHCRQFVKDFNKTSLEELICIALGPSAESWFQNCKKTNCLFIISIFIFFLSSVFLASIWQSIKNVSKVRLQNVQATDYCHVWMDKVIHLETVFVFYSLLSIQVTNFQHDEWGKENKYFLPLQVLNPAEPKGSVLTIELHCLALH